MIRAIERNRAEVEVAPVGLRVAASFAGVAPQLAATLSRRIGGEKVASNLAAAQTDKRG